MPVKVNFTVQGLFRYTAWLDIHWIIRTLLQGAEVFVFGRHFHSYHKHPLEVWLPEALRCICDTRPYTLMNTTSINNSVMLGGDVVRLCQMKLRKTCYTTLMTKGFWPDSPDEPHARFTRIFDTDECRALCDAHSECGSIIFGNQICLLYQCQLYCSRINSALHWLQSICWYLSRLCSSRRGLIQSHTNSQVHRWLCCLVWCVVQLQILPNWSRHERMKIVWDWTVQHGSLSVNSWAIRGLIHLLLKLWIQGDAMLLWSFSLKRIEGLRIAAGSRNVKMSGPCLISF